MKKLAHKTLALGMVPAMALAAPAFAEDVRSPAFTSALQSWGTGDIRDSQAPAPQAVVTPAPQQPIVQPKPPVMLAPAPQVMPAPAPQAAAPQFKPQPYVMPQQIQAQPQPVIAQPKPALAPIVQVEAPRTLNQLAPAAAAPAPQPIPPAPQAAPAPMYQPTPVSPAPVMTQAPTPVIAPAAGVTTLDTVTVVATRSKNKTFNVPGMVSVVKKDAAENAHAGDVKSLLEDVPSLEFEGSARRNGQVPVMRGFKGNSILVLFDGIRQNFESEHDGQFFMDPELLKEVEVVRGPSSTLYGSGGLGGVIAMTTADAADLLKPGQTMGARTTAGFRSVNDEYLTSASAYAKSGMFDLVANISYRQSGDISLGDGSTLQSENAVVGNMFKIGLEPVKGHKLRFSEIGYIDNAEEPNNPQQPLIVGNNDLVDKNVSSRTVRGSYEYSKPEDRLFNTKFQVYNTQTNVEEQVVTPTSLNRRGDILDRDINTNGVDLSNQSRFAFSPSSENVLTYGLEYYVNEQDGRNTGSASGERGGVPDAESQFAGAFIQDEITVKDLGGAPGEVIIIPGLRADHYSSDSETGFSQDEGELSPRAGLTYKPMPWLMAFGNYAHAFRAPNLTELYASGTHFSVGPFQNNFIENPNLAPEKSDGFETGMGLNFNDVASPGDNWRLKGSYYWTDVEDYIDSNISAPSLSPGCFLGTAPAGTCNGGTTQFVNIPTASLEGYEIEAGYENRSVLASLSYAYITGTNDATGAYLTNLVPGTFKAHLAYKLPEYGVTTGWKGQFVQEHDQVNTVTAIRESYTVHDIYLRYRPLSLPSLSIDAGIDNLFDEEYARVFSGAFEPGRSYLAKVSYAW